jgi:hypothetical protein
MVGGSRVLPLSFVKLVELLNLVDIHAIYHFDSAFPIHKKVGKRTYLWRQDVKYVLPQPSTNPLQNNGNCYVPPSSQINATSNQSSPLELIS